MSILDGSFNDIFTIVGLGLALFIALRCLFIFIYPLFCYNSAKIGEIEENLQINENHENNDDNIIPIYLVNIQIANNPIVKIDNEIIEQQEICRIPVATMV